jgi:hypothetical protein
MDLRKKILKFKCLSPLKILSSPFYLWRLLEIFLFLPFFNTFSLFFSMLRLFEGLGF